MTRKSLNRVSAPSFLPSTAVLELTYKCNHSCLFCSCPWFAANSHFDIQPEMTVQAWKSAIDKLASMGCSGFSFTGGEPLLKKGFKEIVRHTSSLTVTHIESDDHGLVRREGSPKLTLLSNGREMSADIIDLCQELGIHLSFSLPGLKAFPVLTDNDTPVDRVLHWIGASKKAGIETTVAVTVTALNIGELHETISAGLLAGADFLLLNRFLPGGKGLAHTKELCLNKEQLQEMLDTAEKVLSLAGRTGSVGTELPMCGFENRNYQNLTVSTHCAAAVGFFVVDPSGFIRVCNHSPKRLVHIKDLDKLKDDPYWKRFTLKKYLPPTCLSCDRIGACDGGCREAAHIYGGSLESMDPLLDQHSE